MTPRRSWIALLFAPLAWGQQKMVDVRVPNGRNVGTRKVPEFRDDKNFKDWPSTERVEATGDWIRQIPAHHQRLKDIEDRFGRKRKNNECPVCGTMASPYKRPTYLEQTGMRSACPGEPACASVIIDSKEVIDPTSPLEIIARCRRCNAAFYQDAEEPKL